MNADETLTLIALVWQVIGPVAKKYRPYVGTGDLASAVFDWVWSNEEKVTALIQGDRLPLLRAVVLGVAERTARAEKAARSGYSGFDEVFYELHKLRAILPDALDPEAVPSQQQQDVSVANSQHGYNEWEAGIADVRSALGKLSTTEYRLLSDIFWERLAPEQVASRQRSTIETVNARINAALRRLQRHLGGREPHTGELP